MFSMLRSTPEKRASSMNAVCVYVSTAQLVLQSDYNDTNALGEQRLGDLCRMFSQLRQLLSCAVCARLLNDPFAPVNNARCQHNVCRLCVRGRKCMRPLCISCKDLQDFKTYVENRQMRCLLLCYKSLCEHLLNTSFFTQLSSKKAPTSQTIEHNISGNQVMHMTTCGDIIQEGARYEDILSAFNSELPHPPLPKLHQPLVTIPVVTATHHTATPLSVNAATPLAPLSVSHVRVHSQTAPKAATPPVPISATPSASSSNALVAPATLKLETTLNHNSQPQMQLTAKQNQTLNVPLQSHTVYVKHLKQVNETSNTVPQLPSTQSHIGGTLAGLPTTPSISYVGPNTPGIVVPIVSSSATTTAPLTIASSKLQSLKRQLTQARNQLGLPAGVAVKTTTLNKDAHAPLTFKVGTTTSAASTSISAANTTANAAPTSAISGTSTTATITSQQIRNPPSIKTVSNGSAMYSVLYTGIGNKITIKRKTDGDEDSAQRKNVATSTSTSSATATPSGNALPTAQQLLANKMNSKRRGCRCGNATPTPGKLTCCGQRCPCYVDSKSCIGCKCRGCRNPHRPDGGKVRPIIPELACYEIQMADENQSLSPSELPVATAINARTTAVSAASPQQLTQQTPTIVSDQLAATTTTSQQHLTTSPSSKGTTLIPFISFHSLPTQQQAQQQTQQPQQQQQTQTLSSVNTNQQSNVLPLESVLIQNAEGKYQVVNVLTTAPHSQSTSTMQRIHNISQLQVAAVNNTNNSANNLTTVNILPTATSSNVTTTAALPQVVLQQQHAQRQQQQHTHQNQQHQHQHHHTHKQLQRIAVNSNSITNNTTNNTIPLQLHHQHHHHTHQIKSNIITMRAPSSTTQTQTLPLISHSSAPATTITLSPIISTFNADMFSDSSESEFISLASNNGTNMLPICSTPNAMSRITAVPSLSSGSNGSTSGSASRMSMGMSMNMATGTHMTPSLGEVIEATDV